MNRDQERQSTASPKGPKQLAKRTVMASVRLAPKLRFAADIAARSQRRTVSSVIEVAVAAYLQTLEVRVPGDDDNERSIKLTKLVESLWDPEESDRLVNVAEKARSLMDLEEELRWKAIREHFNAKGHLTPEQRKDLRSIYDDIKEKVADDLYEKETAKFARK